LKDFTISILEDSYEFGKLESSVYPESVWLWPIEKLDGMREEGRVKALDAHKRSMADIEEQSVREANCGRRKPRGKGTQEFPSRRPRVGRTGNRFA
jgi:hypothetical protein